MKKILIFLAIFLVFFLRYENTVSVEIMPGYSTVCMLHPAYYSTILSNSLYTNLFLLYYLIFYASISFYMPVSITWAFIQRLRNKLKALWLIFLGLISYVFLTVVFQIGFICIPFIINKDDVRFLILQVCIISFMLFALYVNRDSVKALFTKAFWDWKKIGSELLQFFVIAIISGMITCGGMMGLVYFMR